MKNNCILTIVLALSTTPFAAAAQTQSSKNPEAAPSATVLTGSRDGDAEALADVLAIQPPVPLGPLDLLKEYEQAMASTAQGFNAQVSQIAEAVQQGQITEDQGEYLCREAYQLAMMQFQAFSGLHDMLEEELSHTPSAAPPVNPSPAKALSGSDYHPATRKVETRKTAI